MKCTNWTENLALPWVRKGALLRFAIRRTGMPVASRDADMVRVTKTTGKARRARMTLIPGSGCLSNCRTPVQYLDKGLVAIRPIALNRRSAPKS